MVHQISARTKSSSEGSQICNILCNIFLWKFNQVSKTWHLFWIIPNYWKTLLNREEMSNECLCLCMCLSVYEITYTDVSLNKDNGGILLNFIRK